MQRLFGVSLVLGSASFADLLGRFEEVRRRELATLLLIGHGALVSKRFIVTERAKLKSDETGAESNRMLGIAYQAQGQLDILLDENHADALLVAHAFHQGADFLDHHRGKAEKGFVTLERPAVAQEPSHRRDQRAPGRARGALAPRRVGQRGR